MHRHRNLLIIAAAISLPHISGCERDLNLDGYRDPDIERKLVVNSILNPDSVIGVSVTHPYFFSGTHMTFRPDTALDVRVAGGSGEWETLAYDAESQLYLSVRRPVAGEALRLEVMGETGTAGSCDTVPRRVEIEKIEATGEGPMHIYWDMDYRFTYRITFSDPPGEENYYFLSIEDDSQASEFSQMGQVDYTADYVFQELADMINQDIQGWQPDGVFGYPFSDVGISGARYTVTVIEILQTPLVGMIERLPRKISLYAISKPYFEYMVSVLSMDYEESALKGNLLSLGLLEPTEIYTNIEGGAGLMGSYNESTVRVDLLGLTGGWPTN